MAGTSQYLHLIQLQLTERWRETLCKMEFHYTGLGLGEKEMEKERCAYFIKQMSVRGRAGLGQVPRGAKRTGLRLLPGLQVLPASRGVWVLSLLSSYYYSFFLSFYLSFFFFFSFLFFSLFFSSSFFFFFSFFFLLFSSSFLLLLLLFFFRNGGGGLGMGGGSCKKKKFFNGWVGFSPEILHAVAVKGLIYKIIPPEGDAIIQ